MNTVHVVPSSWPSTYQQLVSTTDNQYTITQPGATIVTTDSFGNKQVPISFTSSHMGVNNLNSHSIVLSPMSNISTTSSPMSSHKLHSASNIIGLGGSNNTPPGNNQKPSISLVRNSSNQNTASSAVIITGSHSQNQMTTPTNRNTRHIINATTATATPSSGISSAASANDHEYGRFSTPITPNSSLVGTPGSSGVHIGGSQPIHRRIYVTPSTSRGVGGNRAQPQSASAALGGGRGSVVVGHAGKPEARRKLNLDSAPVDREGFKTPIKATHGKRGLREVNVSSPSPKKSKFFG